MLALGKPEGVELVPKLPGFNGARMGSSNNTSGVSVVEVIRPQAIDGGLLPGRSLGYDAFDAVIVDTNDKNLMASMVVQGQAIVDWVAGGGHLVVTVGANWQAARDSVLGPILPAVPAGMTQINDVRTVEAFASATSQIVPVSADNRTTLAVARLEGADAKGSKVLCTTSTSPIVVRGAHGFGRVTLVGLDVDGPPFASWADRGLFWVKTLDFHPAASTASANQARARFIQSGNADLSSKLRAALEQFPGVKLIPFGWVAFFIFLYILMIGPGDYLFLRRVLKRMELTWITFPTIVVAVSALAYWAAYRAKGTELRVNQVDMVDVDIPAKRVRGTTFANVFSPENRDYDVAIVPTSLRGGPDRTGDSETWISWYASPEPGLRGMNGGGQSIGFGANGYTYAPEGRVERLSGVRVPIWSTKAFTARWSADDKGEPIVESDLMPNGLDRLNGTITNRLDLPLKKAVLAFNNRVYYNLGDIAPGQTIRVELTEDRLLSGLLRDNQRLYDTEDDPFGGKSAAANRVALVQAILFHDSDTTGVTPLPSRPLHDLDLTGQLLLDRPILMAEVDRPASRLDLGAVPSPAKTIRTTVLRVILPLNTAATKLERTRSR